MTTADLGYPILVSILIIWAFFALIAFLATFLRKKNLLEFKNYVKRLTDSRPHRRGSSESGLKTPEGGGI